MRRKDERDMGRKRRGEGWKGWERIEMNEGKGKGEEREVIA